MWGFTKLPREIYEKARAEDRLAHDGVYSRLEKQHGPLDHWKKNHWRGLSSLARVSVNKNAATLILWIGVMIQ